MKTVETFLENAIKPPEADLAAEYRKALADVEKEQTKLLRFLRVRDGAVVVLPAVSEVLPSIKAADESLVGTKARVDAYLVALGEYGSVQNMVERLGREKRTRANLDRDVQSLVERKVRAGLTATQAEASEDVLQLMDKRDRARIDLDKSISELTARIDKAREAMKS